MTVEQAEQLALRAAAAHNVTLVGIRPDPLWDGYEVRMENRRARYYCVLMFSENMPLDHFKTEVENLAGLCAAGPSN